MRIRITFSLLGKRSHVEALERNVKQKEERKSHFCLKMTQNKHSSSLSGQLSETKPNKIGLEITLKGNKSLLCLEFKNPNKQYVYDIH